MTEDNFFGRPLNEGYTYFDFNICEVCLHKSAKWMESYGNNNSGYVIRFTCEDCHQDFILNSNKTDSNIVTELTESEIIDPERPSWMEEFIRKGDTIELVSEQPISDINDTEEAIAGFDSSWSSKFIQESLFGDNAVDWLEKSGRFEEENTIRTISVLASLASNQIKTVKENAILALKRLYFIHPKFKSSIVNTLNLFKNPNDEEITELVNQVLSEIY